VVHSALIGVNKQNICDQYCVIAKIFCFLIGDLESLLSANIRSLWWLNKIKIVELKQKGIAFLMVIL